jgi:hypothetical protein
VNVPVLLVVPMPSTLVVICISPMAPLKVPTPPTAAVKFTTGWLAPSIPLGISGFKTSLRHELLIHFAHRYIEGFSVSIPKSPFQLAMH